MQICAFFLRLTLLDWAADSMSMKRFGVYGDVRLVPEPPALPLPNKRGTAVIRSL